MKSFRFLLLLQFPVLFASCSVFKEKEPEPIDVKQMVVKPLSPEKTEELLSTVGENWFYGQGVGDTAIKVGTVLVFPPYALYLLGNGILNLSGYESVHITDALPDEPKEHWDNLYASVSSAPGHLNAAIAGKEFVRQEVAKEKLEQIIKEANTKP